jgi:hypothetical protein
MKIICLILLTLTFAIVKAQPAHFKATIVDAQTHLPVPNTFVSIRLKNQPIQADNSDKRFYYKADTAGKVEFSTSTPTDSITISCFNYQTQVITVNSIPADHILKLVPIIKPQTFEADHSVLIHVGSKKMNGKYYNVSVPPGYDNAMFMHNSQDIQGIIQTVGFYITSGKGNTKGDATAPFRIRVFKIDTAAGPGEELTKDIIITSAKKSNAWCDVDLSAYNLESPCDGFYVSFNLLDSGYYKIKKGAPTLDMMGKPLEYGAMPQDIVMPRLAYTTDEFEMPRSYYSVNRTMLNWTRHWMKDHWNFSYMVRAGILAPTYGK